MAKLDHSNTTTYRIINVCVILTLAYSIFSIAVFLRIKTAICPTTALGINASIALSLPTIAAAAVRCCLIRRQRNKHLQSISPSTASPWLESACTASVQFLVFFWVVLACVNLLVAVRVPVCLDQPLAEWHNTLQEQNWKYGMSCRLHRGLVALSVLMALSVTCLSFLDSINRHREQPRRGMSLVSCYFTYRKPHKSHAFAPSLTSSRSWSTLDKDEFLNRNSEHRSSQFEPEHWRRRNSLSSQKAIYPHRYQYYDQRPRYTPNSLPSNRYSSTLRSVSEGHDMEPGGRYSSMTSSRSSNTWATTRPSTISSSRTRSTSNPERGDLRREKPTDSTTGKAGIPDVLPVPTLPPPAWAPTLHHAPFSADPTLRALSTGATARPSLPHSNSSPNLLVQALQVSKRRVAEPITSAGTSTPTRKTEMRKTRETSPRKQTAPPMPSMPPPPVPPTLPTQAAPPIPARAPGHSVRHNPARPPMSTNISASTALFPQATSSVPMSRSQSSSRRPDPIRHRQHQNPYAGLGISSNSQLQLPLQQYQHQRVWKYGHGRGPSKTTRNSSVYSASSYGTHATGSRISCHTRASHVYTNSGNNGATPSIRPVTNGKQ